MLPQLVEAAAKSIEGSQLTVVNGAQGVNDLATGMAAQGLSIYETLRAALLHRDAENGTANGALPHEEQTAAP